MTVEIWRGYASNNSTSYRLVARFVDASAATAIGTELRALLATDRDQIAARYGIAWEEILGEDSAHDTPEATEVATEGGVLVAYHDYNLGFGPALPAFLGARGADSVDEPAEGAPSVSIRFAYAGGNAALDDELAALFAQLAQPELPAIAVPWTQDRHYRTRRAAGFRDARSVGLYLPTTPGDLAALRAWLAGHDIATVSLQLCEDGDAAKYAAIARARCTSCAGPLVFLDPRLGDPEAEAGLELMACYACGGLYDLATFTAGHVQ